MNAKFLRKNLIFKKLLADCCVYTECFETCGKYVGIMPFITITNEKCTKYAVDFLMCLI